MCQGNTSSRLGKGAAPDTNGHVMDVWD